MTDKQRVADALADPELILSELAMENRVQGEADQLQGDEGDPARRYALVRALREFYQLGDAL